MTGIELKEAITELEFVVDRFYDFPEETGVSNNINNVQNAIKAIKELEDYYAIGTVERFQQLSEQFKPHMADETSCPERHCNKCDKYRKENEKYHKIGTVEECREAMERQRGKKPVKDKYKHDCCPNCGWIVYRDEWGGRYLPHCENCGQAIDWSE